jgi:hypothetical protein
MATNGTFEIYIKRSIFIYSSIYIICSVRGTFWVYAQLSYNTELGAYPFMATNGTNDIYEKRSIFICSSFGGFWAYAQLSYNNSLTYIKNEITIKQKIMLEAVSIVILLIND